MRMTRKVRYDAPVLSSLSIRERWIGGRFVLLAVVTLLMHLALIAQSMAAPAYPWRPNANNRYIVDSNGVPFLIIGDALHSLLANLATNDATTYLTKCGQRGNSTDTGFAMSVLPVNDAP